MISVVSFHVCFMIVGAGHMAVFFSGQDRHQGRIARSRYLRPVGDERHRFWKAIGEWAGLLLTGKVVRRSFAGRGRDEYSHAKTELS